MGYLKVKNWEKFQHYKDRNPPWIKLHRTLLDDYEFSCLQDASKAHLMLIWLFASQKNGLIPDDPAFLKMKLGLELEPDLKLLTDKGLLSPEHDAIKPLAPSKQVAPRDRDRDRTPIAPSGAFLRFWGAWPKGERKRSQGKCWELWRKKDWDQLAEQVLAHVEAMKSSDSWARGYVPAPLTYLNQRQWEGAEPAEAPKPQVAMP